MQTSRLQIFFTSPVYFEIFLSNPSNIQIQNRQKYMGKSGIKFERMAGCGTQSNALVISKKV